MVLTPQEFNRLLEQPQKDVSVHKVRLEFLLNTGMRYAEAKRFVFEDYNYKNRVIHKPQTGKTNKQKERWIHLTPKYNEKLNSVRELLKLKDTEGLEFPTLSGYQKNLERWFKKAGINHVRKGQEKGDLVKMFRKTRECWYVVSGFDSSLVALDQGHTDLIQLAYYLSNPFGEVETREIMAWSEGWIK